MRRTEREIRDVLCGKTVPGEGGKLQTVERGQFFLPQGVSDGAAGVRLLGMGRASRCYHSALAPKKTLQTVEECMRNIGRGVLLREQPEAVACLIRYVLTRPALLVFRYVEDVPVLTVWVGRGLTGWISRRRAISAFERQLPQSVSPTGQKPPKEAKAPDGRDRKKRKRNRRGPEEQTEPDAPDPENADNTEKEEPEGDAQ